MVPRRTSGNVSPVRGGEPVTGQARTVPQGASGLHKMTVAVFAFIRQDDSILLVRQSTGNQYWSLPGGVVEAGESLAEAVVREGKEETGLDVRVGRMVGVYSKVSEDGLAITFEAEMAGGTVHADNEILECRWFPLTSLPEHVRGHFRQRVADFVANTPQTVCAVQ